MVFEDKTVLPLNIVLALEMSLLGNETREVDVILRCGVVVS